MIQILKRISLKARLYFLATTSVVLISGLAVMAILNVYTLRDTPKQVYAQDHKETKILYELEVLIDRARLAELDLSVGHNPANYENNVQNLYLVFNEVNSKVAFMADASKVYDNKVRFLVQHLKAWWVEYRKVVTGKLEVAFKSGRYIYEQGIDMVSQQNRFKEIIHDIDMLEEQQEVDNTEALVQAKVTIDGSVKKLLVTAVVVFTVMGLILYYMFNKLSGRLRQIKRIQTGLESVKTGDFDIKLDIGESSDLGILTKDFNRMARQLYEDKINQEQSAMVLGWYADESSKKATKLVKLNYSLTRMQTELVSKNKRLNESIEEVKEINKQLQKTERQMIQSEKMASIGQLSAGVAHEINNPIGFVNSNLTTLSKYVQDFVGFFQINTPVYKAIKSGDITAADNALGEVEKFIEKSDIEFAVDDVACLLEESKGGIERVVSIIKGLKDFSHAGTHELSDCDINDCLEDTIKLCWHEIKYKAKVETDFGELPMLQCHKQKVSQVFINILINAVQAIPKQGVIRVVTYADEESVVIKISDNGEGMSAKVAGCIFDPFFTTKPVGKGTGLGLSIVYGIVQEHDGSMDVETEDGLGTTFIIKFPIKRSERLGRIPEIREAG